MKENYKIERKPLSDFFNLLYCGSIAGKPAICNGYKMNSDYTKELADIALGNREPDLILKNGNIINVFTNEIQRGDVAIKAGLIVGIGDYSGKNQVDVTGKYICPGFIDSHLHLESTLVRPAELVNRAAKKGTTTFIVDPHEAANVAGIKGIKYILEQTEDVQANVFVMIPSCVPAVEFEDNGAVITAEEIKPFLSDPRVLGLGEVMDDKAVLRCDEKLLDKLRIMKSKIIDGHAGFLDEKQLMCYRLAGIETDHECCDFETAMREARTGIQILVREGTAAKNLDNIVKGIVRNQVPVDQFAFCTDDRHIAEIEQQGHISYHVKRAIELGMAPADAVKMATINAAKTYGLKNLGAVAPGYQADLCIFSDFQTMEIETVYVKGRKIQADDTSVFIDPDPELTHTVKLGKVDLDSFKLCPDIPEIPVINIVEGQIFTRKTVEKVPLVDGAVQLNENYSKAAVFERHRATGKRGLGVLKGYAVRNGAIASTFCHDSHNLIVVGDNDRDMLLAVKELERCGGGYTIVENGEVAYTLELPIMGLISTQKNEAVTKKLSEMIKKAHDMGISENMDPFITLSFLALPVIPEIRVTARGIYDVQEEKFMEPIGGNMYGYEKSNSGL